MIKYLSTIETLSSSRTVQIQDEEQNVLLYGIPQKPGVGGGFLYDFLVLPLSENDTADIDAIRLKLKKYGENLLNSSAEEASAIFNQLVHELFDNPTRKIVFLGFPNSGKTSTKKSFFELFKQETPLETTLEPTIGFENAYYNLIDMNISLFDTSGQELDQWFDNEDLVLLGSDLIIMFFSVEDWNNNSERVLSYIIKLHDFVQRNREYQGHIIIFCHKFDLIKENQEEFKDRIQGILSQYNFPLFFTTLENGGNGDLYLGFQLITEKFSQILIIGNELITPLLKTFNYQPLFLLDSANRIVWMNNDKNYSSLTYPNLSQFCGFIISKAHVTFSEGVDMFLISIGTKQKFVLGIDLSEIYSGFSYIILNWNH